MRNLPKGRPLSREGGDPCPRLLKLLGVFPSTTLRALHELVINMVLEQPVGPPGLTIHVCTAKFRWVHTIFKCLHPKRAKCVAWRKALTVRKALT